MSETAAETKPEAAEKPNLPVPEVAKPEQPAAPAGGGETVSPAGAPSQEPDWKAQFADLKTKYDAISTQVPNLVKGMNEAQQRAAFYEKQTQALAGVQKPERDELEVLAEQAADLESRGYFAEAAPIRTSMAIKSATKAAREEFLRLNQQQAQQGFHSKVNDILRSEYGLDPAALDVNKATADPYAVAEAIARANNPDVAERIALKRVEERRKAAERASQMQSFGGGSGGRGIPPNGPQTKPRMSFITYAALPKSRKTEIRTMARNGQIELFSVSGRGAAERMETIDPRDLTDE